MSNTTRWTIIALVTAAVVIALFFVHPIAQWPEYHQFADTRSYFGIPNFWNMFSNIGILLVGIWGYFVLGWKWSQREFADWREMLPYAAMVTGIFLTGIGSSYYHWAPDNATNVWDRLPLTMIFTSIVSIILLERVGLKTALWSLGPLLLMGFGSVLYWIWTESLGRGDLRPYAFVQFYPPVFIAMVLYFFRKPFPRIKDLLLIIAFYAVAKGFELGDLSLYQLTGTVSGHPLKHLFATLSVAWMVLILTKRKAS
jgi:hypothetical protein